MFTDYDASSPSVPRIGVTLLVSKKLTNNSYQDGRDKLEYITGEAKMLLKSKMKGF